jgi:hypothetical protein
VAVETGWMAAAETRVPDATKALAEREASMDETTIAARSDGLVILRFLATFDDRARVAISGA